MEEQLKEAAYQLREARSNEANFEMLVSLLERECQRAKPDSDFINELKEIQEKDVANYRKAKEAGGSAWPEFEHFVSRFEKTLLSAMKG